MIKNLLIVGLGGGLGSIIRYLSGVIIGRNYGFPLSTFMVNVIGSFIIGTLLARYGSHTDEQIRLLFVVGFCGGFTTFSSFSAETLHLIQSGQVFIAALYVFGSIVLGLLAVYLGYAIFK